MAFKSLAAAVASAVSKGAVLLITNAVNNGDKREFFEISLSGGEFVGTVGNGGAPFIYTAKNGKACIKRGHGDEIECGLSELFEEFGYMAGKVASLPEGYCNVNKHKVTMTIDGENAAVMFRQWRLKKELNYILSLMEIAVR